MNKKFNIFKISTWVIVIALVTVLFSCNTSMDFAKRRYSSGYYVSLGGKHTPAKQKESELSFAKKAKSVNNQSTVQSLPQTETTSPVVVKNDVSSEVAAPAVADNTLTASTDATPVVFATKVDFTKHVKFPVANINQTYVAANTSAKSDASSKSSNHKAWYLFGGVAAFFATLGAVAFGAKKRGGSDKSWIACVLICFFLGRFGIHRFYMGYIWQGVVQLLTGGGCLIWSMIDFIRILMKDLKPKDGDYS